ncbi:hypothetical protein BJV82DRAFT_626979 [Fennellomyces sp. T-0311]|nr:hypothetical protein BJV82DRAFT_626979 [Fennellomyces sp. T-0311]
MNNITLSPNHIKLEPIQQLLDQLSKALKTRDYRQIVSDATAAIDLVLQSQLLTLFDIRSYAFAKQGHFDSAFADAQQMIDYAPKQAAGYARKACVLSMYGHHKKAISACKDGLQYAKTDDKCIKRLREGKDSATVMSDMRLDFIAQLPLELAHEVILQFSTEAKAVGLTVSSMWRKRIIECTDAWNTVEVNGKQEQVQLVNAIPYVGRHIEHLTINTADNTICLAYFKHIKSERFPKIRSLKLSALTTKEFDPAAARTSMSSLQACMTLTKLVVSFSKSESIITLADVLTTCVNLTELSYTTTSTLSGTNDASTTVNRHDALRSLKLKSNAISDGHIKAVLQQCPQLRRLVMLGANPSVFNPIIKYGEKLQILGYNSRSSLPYPIQGDDTQEHGLRIVCTNDGTTAVPASLILPLLYKHRKTLETVFVDISSILETDLQRFYTTYPDFKFEKLTTLTFWPFKGIQQFMLRTIKDTVGLRYLSMVNVSNLEYVVDAIIHLPALTTLRLSHVKSTANCSSLVSLFSAHAMRSESQKSLETIKFRHCDGITDAVLFSLASIKTLQRAIFYALKGTKAKGLREFFRNTGDQLKEVKLAEMDFVTDNVVADLGNLRSVKYVELNGLPKVTDEGIRSMLDKESCNMDKLTISACTLVTFECIQYARKKVKTVVAK